MNDTRSRDVRVEWPDGASTVFRQGEDPFRYIHNREGKFIAFADGTSFLLPGGAVVVEVTA